MRASTDQVDWLDRIKPLYSSVLVPFHPAMRMDSAPQPGGFNLIRKIAETAWQRQVGHCLRLPSPYKGQRVCHIGKPAVLFQIIENTTAVPGTQGNFVQLQFTVFLQEQIHTGILELSPDDLCNFAHYGKLCWCRYKFSLRSAIDIEFQRPKVPVIEIALLGLEPAPDVLNESNLTIQDSELEFVW